MVSRIFNEAGARAMLGPRDRETTIFSLCKPADQARRVVLLHGTSGELQPNIPPWARQ